MLMKKPRYRVFDYTPRFYKPEDDESEHRKRRLGFRKQRKHIQKRRSPVFLVLLILVVIYIILQLNGLI